MANDHPAFSLLVGLCLTLMIGIPLLSWLLLMGKRDRQASIWFAGLLVNIVGVVAIAVMHKSSAIPPVSGSAALAMLMVSMRMELVPSYQAPWQRMGALLACYAVVQGWLDFAGLRLTWGVGLGSLVLTVQSAMVLVEVYRVMLRDQSRSLLSVMLGLAMLAFSNAWRVGSVIVHQDSPQIFAFTITSNLIILGVTLSTLLFSFGYGAFMLEKSHRRRLQDQQVAVRAEERRQAAQEHADQLQQIIEQRDAMILLATRFSVVNSMAVFNSAIVHEISQPLQALRTLLDLIALTPEVQNRCGQKLEQANKVVLGMAKTLNSLRNLVQKQEPHLEAVRVDAALAEIEPIMQTQARHQRVALQWSSDDAVGRTLALADKVMLQRIVFNLMANALEVLSPGPLQGKVQAIELTTRLHEHNGVMYAVVRVQDSGPGFTEEMLQKTEGFLFTTKPQGTGTGLALARIIVQSWRGDLKISNRAVAEGGGGCVELWIPVQTPA